MLEKTKIKDFLIYYISQRIIIFPIYEYLPILANITVYKETLLNSEYSEYFLNYETFSNIVKYKIKKKTKYFKEIKNDSLFLNTEGYYKNIRVGVPSGEDIEFFHKLNKLK